MTSLKLPEDLVAESLDDVDQLLKILGSESQRQNPRNSEVSFLFGMQVEKSWFKWIWQLLVYIVYIIYIYV